MIEPDKVRIIEILRDDAHLVPLPSCKYASEGHYDVRMTRTPSGWRVDLVYERLKERLQKSYVGRLFEDHIAEPKVFAAEVAGKQIGWIELGYESWNNRVRVWEFLVLEEARRQGVGTLLMNRAVEWTKDRGARMLVLETQSNNAVAISFYLKFGFDLVGFDSAAYSNDDVAKREVRLELGLKL